MRLFLSAALAALVLAAGATADDVVVPVVVRPGSLALAPVTALARNGRISVTVSDARGKGAGWTLLARSAGPTGMLVVTGVEVHCGARSTCTLPRTRIRYPMLLSFLRLTPVFKAEPGTGLGTVSVTLSLAVARPALLGVALRFTLRPS